MREALGGPPTIGAYAEAEAHVADFAATPVLPAPRGELSAAITDHLREAPGGAALPAHLDTGDALGGDLQTALLTCYELHYRGFAGVDPRWEWDPGVLAFRAGLERSFLAALRGRAAGGDDAGAVLDAAIAERPDDRGPAHHLRDAGSWWQMQEYFIHRSVYQLKEADPYLWVIPRLHGQAKASMTAVEFDEFGAGHGRRVHARLFADLLAAAGLDARYFGYVDAVPAPTLAVANLATLFGLHRAWRGALIGHFAVTEASTGPGAARLERALNRMEAPQACVHFYSEHIEADAVHEQVVRHDVVRPLLEAEPELAADVVFGIQAVGLLEGDLGEMLLDRWDDGRSSLLPAA